MVNDQGHEVALQVVPLAGQQEHAVPGLRAELELELDVLVGRVEGGKREPAQPVETRRPNFRLCNRGNSKLHFSLSLSLWARPRSVYIYTRARLYLSVIYPGSARRGRPYKWEWEDAPLAGRRKGFISLFTLAGGFGMF